MKRIVTTTLVLIALLAFTTGPAFAGSALELMHVQNGPSGPTFTFRVTGEFSQSELESGFVQVEGGDDFPLYCSQTDSDTVVCHTSKKVGGHDVVVGFGGARFWAHVKEAGQKGYCYSVWDWWEATGWQWTDFGPYCQDEAASPGSWIEYDTGFGWTGFAEFYDVDVSDNCGIDSVPYNGPAYYYPGCP